MKNLDLYNTRNLDESFSNISQESIDSLAGLATTIGTSVIQNRTTPKNDEERSCGVRPLNANKSKLESWNKCVDRYTDSKRVSNQGNQNNTPAPEKSNTVLIVSIIAGVVLIGGGITAFLMLRKKS